MNKGELISAFIEKTNISRSQAVSMVNMFFDNLTSAFIEGKRVEIRGLFSFSIRNYEKRIGSNPQTGEKIEIPPRKLPLLKIGKKLKKQLNNEE